MQTSPESYLRMSDLERMEAGRNETLTGARQSLYNSKATVEVSDEHSATIVGYRYNRLKVAFTVIMTALTLGLFMLVLHWRATWRMRVMCDVCPLIRAQIILIDLDGPVPLNVFANAAETELAGIDVETAARRMVVYGKNMIEVKLKPILVLLFREVITPFYVFQIFSVTLWYNDEYYYYASVIVIMSTISITLDVYQTRKLERAVHDMVQSSDVVRCVRNGEPVTLASEDMVPGDVLWLSPAGGVLQCDAVLLSGTCIVNESMLTGESVPVTKTAMTHPESDTETYNSRDHARHTLYCGTKLLQTRYYAGQPVRAMVIRTGYATLKGQLVRSIMYPKPIDFRFTKDLFRFVALLAVIAFVGLCYSAVIMTMHGVGPKKILLRTLDVVTIVVPPALPAAMTIGILAAQARLRRQKIFCISPSTINTCGAVSVVVFDKTGTLTEDGLDFQCALPVGTKDNVDVSDRMDVGTLPELSSTFLKRKTHLRRWRALPFEGALAKAVACCHSLTRINDELRGDPLDLVLFDESGWSLIEAGSPDEGESNANLSGGAVSSGNESERFDQLAPTVVRSPLLKSDPSSCTELGILRQFPFSSGLQRQSVIVRDLEFSSSQSRTQESSGVSGDTTVYTKGAPERVAALCRPDSVPGDFSQVVAKFAQHGYRLIAVACKALARVSAVKLQRMARDSVECNLTFLGLVVLENRLKAATKPVLKELHGAGLRCVMATGDNVLTAASVAREAGIVFAHLTDADAGEFYLLDLNKADEITIERMGAAAPINPLARTGRLRQPGSVAGREWGRTLSTQSDASTEDGHMSPSFLVSDIGGENVQHMPAVPECDTVEVFDDETGGSAAPDRRSVALAVTGPAFARLVHDCEQDVVDRFVSLCDVYARMSPEHKSLLVEKLQDVDYTVAMCGDGANDCGALKSAHAGISLSDAEASIASPFTSKVADISCVSTVIREGRAALVTSFGVFKYMAGYSLTQFMTVLMLYYIATNLSDFQFLYIDMFLITTFAVCFGYQDASTALYHKPPPVRIMSLPSAASIVGNLMIIAAFQVYVFLNTSGQPWFFPFADPGDEDSYDTYQGTSVFLLTCYQYIALAVVYSKGYPHRKSLFNNRALCLAIMFCLVITVWVTLEPPDFLTELLDLKMPPYFEYRVLLLLLALISGFLNYLFESIVVDWMLAKYSDTPFSALFNICMLSKRKDDRSSHFGLVRNTTYQQLRVDAIGQRQRSSPALDVGTWLTQAVADRNARMTAAHLCENAEHTSRSDRAPTWPMSNAESTQLRVGSLNVSSDTDHEHTNGHISVVVGSAPTARVFDPNELDSPVTQTSILEGQEPKLMSF